MINCFKSNKTKKDRKRDTVLRDRDQEKALGLRDETRPRLQKTCREACLEIFTSGNQSMS